MTGPSAGQVNATCIGPAATSAHAMSRDLIDVPQDRATAGDAAEIRTVTAPASRNTRVL